jgi:hypothetical protein
MRGFGVAGVLLFACSSPLSSEKVGANGIVEAGTGAAGGAADGAASLGGTGGSAGVSGANTGGSSGAGGTDGGGINCWTGSFPVFDRGCTSAQSCVLVSHQSNRCGSSAMMAISQTEQARFDRAEATCEAQYLSMPTGCYSSQVTLDDGTTIGSASEAIADCVDSKCESRYKGATFPCGSETCTAVQFCYQDPAGFACVEDAGCVKSCAGCSSAYSACTCNSVEGHTVIICGPP